MKVIIDVPDNVIPPEILKEITVNEFRLVVDP